MKLFKEQIINSRREHGGGINKGKRKVRRPFDSKNPMHIVLRASKASGKYSLLLPENKAWIETKTRELSKKWEVRLHEFANAGNHLHMITYCRSRKSFQGFLRVLTGQISMHVAGSRKGNSFGRFWDELAYTRIATWGRQFKTVQKYVFQNMLEADGVFSRKEPLAKYALEDWWERLRAT